MIHIKKIDDGVPVFKALGSEIRINIIKLLLENKEMSMNEIAKALGVTNGALTSHIRMLEETGIIVVLSERSVHGNKKMCRLKETQIMFDVGGDENSENDVSIHFDLCEEVNERLDKKMWEVLSLKIQVFTNMFLATNAFLWYGNLSDNKNSNWRVPSTLAAS